MARPFTYGLLHARMGLVKWYITFHSVPPDFVFYVNHLERCCVLYFKSKEESILIHCLRANIKIQRSHLAETKFDTDDLLRVLIIS